MKTFIFKNEVGKGYIVATADSLEEARENCFYGNYNDGELITEMDNNSVCPLIEDE